MPSTPIELRRPMLAAPTKEAELRALTWPKLISPKLDGVRALCRRNPVTGQPELVSRKLLPIPNAHCQALFAREELVGLDGELCVGPSNAKNLMQATTSGVMSEAGEPAVRWYVFDRWDSEQPYAWRAYSARQLCHESHAAVRWLPHSPVNSYDDMLYIESQYVDAGYEGAILRCPQGLYKQGRSTLKQAYLLKVKRFVDAEAEVLGCVEQMRNENEATVDETGYTKRSTHAAGKVCSGKLGALKVRDAATGVEFEVGTGFTDEQRINLWEGQKYLIGKLIKYKSFAIGVKDKPRFPVFLGFRDRRDT